MKVRHAPIGMNKRFLAVILWIALPLTVARAAENGASVYPAGVETVMPGMLPGPGQTLLLEFNNFYQANALKDGNGHDAMPGFHLRVAAVAVKVVHNWGVHALGGTLVSSAAVPILYEHLDLPFGKFSKEGMGNPDFGVLDVAYHKGDFYWWYGLDAFTPGAQYKKEDSLNVGQHYFATAPVGAFSYLPENKSSEISSRFNYIVNYTNPANQYHSGNEFLWEYAAMHNVTKSLALGVNGYFDRQTTDDRLNGAVVESGNRGRVLAIGPEARYHLGHVALILKYQREMLAENRTMGNSFWMQIGMPIGHHEQ